jgi:hypothetical protein
MHTKRWQRNIALPDGYFGFCEKIKSLKSSTTRQELLWSKTLTSSSKRIITKTSENGTKHIDHQAQNPRPSKNHEKRKFQKVTKLDAASWKLMRKRLKDNTHRERVRWSNYTGNDMVVIFVTSSETYHTDVKISARGKQTTVPVAQMR